MSPIEMGERLTVLARQGKLSKIKSYHLAGANLNSVNITKQTSLHAAIEAGQKEVWIKLSKSTFTTIIFNFCMW